MQNASKFAAEWTDTICANSEWDCGSEWALPGYLGTMGCEIDEVLNDLMREMDDWRRIHDLDTHAPGDLCNLYAGETSFHFEPTMSRDALRNELHRLAAWAGLPE